MTSSASSAEPATESEPQEAPRNLDFQPLPELSWLPEDRAASLEAVVGYVSEEAKRAISWYLAKKGAKRRGAQGLRLSAILATVLAGLIPLMAQIFEDHEWPHVAPGWASVALVIAAACVGLDHFFGYSSAWMRFLTTEMQIRCVLHDFRLEWEAQRAAWNGEPPTAEDVESALQMSRSFLANLNDILKAEMHTWVREFSVALRDIDRTSRGRGKGQ